MNILIITLVTFLCLISLLLIVVVLLQNPKDETGYVIGNMGIQQVVGISRMPQFLEKFTYFLAFCLLVLTLVLSSQYNRQYGQKDTKSALENLAGGQK